jgi:hypothetical protein
VPSLTDIFVIVGLGVEDKHNGSRLCPFLEVAKDEVYRMKPRISDELEKQIAIQLTFILFSFMQKCWVFANMFIKSVKCSPSFISFIHGFMVRLQLRAFIRSFISVDTRTITCAYEGDLSSHINNTFKMYKTISRYKKYEGLSAVECLIFKNCWVIFFHVTEICAK